MNEQDLILKQKIEKREKIDTILAYILIVILLGLILLVLYLKFLRKEDMVEPEEYVPNYISINEISNSLNNSSLANLYLNDAANFSSSVSNNVLMVTYSKEDTNISLNIPQIGNELEIPITEANRVVSKDVYKEIAAITCMYYGNSELNCRSVINNASENNQIDGIRFVNNRDNNYVYISIDRSIDVNASITYNEVTKTNIEQTNYTLNLEGIKIYNLNIAKGNEALTFSGTIERTGNDNSNVTVNIKLYDANGEEKFENRYIYDEDNMLVGKDTFYISFMMSQEGTDIIKSYAIEVIK